MSAHAAVGVVDNSYGFCKYCPWQVIPDTTIAMLDVEHWDPISDQHFYVCRTKEGEPLCTVATPMEPRILTRPSKTGVPPPAPAYAGRHRWDRPVS